MRLRVLNAEPLFDYREECKLTQGIDIFDEYSLFEPKDETEFWIKQIVANHSCIRCIKFRVVDKAPKSVIMQLIRATKGHPQPEVESSRPDWTGKERSKDSYELKLFAQDHTAESFIEMAKQRLCNRTEKNTREYMWKIVKALQNSDDAFLKAVGYCCHPYCWWYKGCPELKSCGMNPHRVFDDIKAELRQEEVEVPDKPEMKIVKEDFDPIKCAKMMFEKKEIK